jgi:hypothetical protein
MRRREGSQVFLTPMNADQKFWTIDAAFLSAFIGVHRRSSAFIGVHRRSSAFIGVKIPCGVAHRHSEFGGFNLRCTMIPLENSPREAKIRAVNSNRKSTSLQRALHR